MPQGTVRRDRQGPSDAHFITNTKSSSCLSSHIQPAYRSIQGHDAYPSVPFFFVAPLVPPVALFLAPAFGLARGLLADLLADFLTELLLPPPPPPVLFCRFFAGVLELSISDPETAYISVMTIDQSRHRSSPY